jgi:hypothetical protein
MVALPSLRHRSHVRIVSGAPDLACAKRAGTVAGPAPPRQADDVGEQAP